MVAGQFGALEVAAAMFGGSGRRILRKVREEVMDFGVRVSLILIPCREIKTLTREIFYSCGKIDIYRRQERYMGKNLIT